MHIHMFDVSSFTDNFCDDTYKYTATNYTLYNYVIYANNI